MFKRDESESGAKKEASWRVSRPPAHATHVQRSLAPFQTSVFRLLISVF